MRVGQATFYNSRSYLLHIKVLTMSLTILSSIYLTTVLPKTLYFFIITGNVLLSQFAFFPFYMVFWLSLYGLLCCRPYRLSFHEIGLISYASPILLVHKKSGEPHIVVDLCYNC